MQSAIAPAMHSIRSGQDDTDQSIQQALLMAGHSIAEAQQTSMDIDHPDATSSNEGKRGSGKRELSTSKRAAQNRAAQRAFRQRKEGHIKKLEEQVRDYQTLAESYKAVQAENYQLRDYIINLQSRLIESQGEFPPAPGNIDLRQPVGGPPTSHVLLLPPPRAASGPGANISAVQPPKTKPTTTTMMTTMTTAGTGLAVQSIQGGAAGGKEPKNKSKKSKNEIVDPSLSRA